MMDSIFVGFALVAIIVAVVFGLIWAAERDLEKEIGEE